MKLTENKLSTEKKMFQLKNIAAPLIGNIDFSTFSFFLNVVNLDIHCETNEFFCCC